MKLLFFEDLLEETFHCFPGTLIRLFIVGRSLFRIITGIRIGEAVHRVAIADKVPVNAPVSHFVLECCNLLGLYEWVIRTVERKHFPLYVLRISG